ncbi:MAG TPA: nitrate reductase [Acidimicrobiales bacterium]|nr:nitrate reductase [Acidimicrobiales bacterium]
MSLLRRRNGPLTDELRRVPGDFGVGQVPAAIAPQQTIPTVCGFCSTGCSLDVHMRDGVPVNLTPSASYPVNLGMACPKGWEAMAPLAADDRATTPLLRDDRGRLRPVDWDTALDAFVGRMKAVQAQHGAEAVAFLGTGQMPTEELALLGALAKFGLGVVHGDGNTRQCMATSVVAYKQAFGFDAPPYTYADFEESDVVVLIGSNLCIAHPIMWQRICRNRHRPEVVVVDPRTTETAVAATQHYAIRPKSDLVFLYGLARILLERGWVDRGFVDAHTDGFEAFASHVSAFTPERVAAESGIEPAALERLAATIHGGQRVSFWWTMGVNQSHQGVRTAQAVVNLALMTGNIGRPGTGANSITGQCNAMGSRLFANTTNLFGGRDFTVAEDRNEVAGILDIDPARIPDRPSWAYDQIVEGIVGGRIRALWVVATNPAHSWINQGHLHDVLSRLDFLVVQDMYATTETAAVADLVLPAAGWGEKDGTFVNSERRIGRIKRVAEPPGDAVADFEIFKRIADRWGCADLFARWRTPEDVFRSLAVLSRGRPCDFSALDGYASLDGLGYGVQWPVPAGVDPAALDRERRLFGDGRFFHPDGRARFVFDDPAPPRDVPSKRYPLVLLTGRGTSAEWHTGTRTSKSSVLRMLAPSQLHVELHPDDAEERSIRADEWVVVASSRGSVRARAYLTATVRRGEVFLPMHDAGVNMLTVSSFDPHSRQPSYKYTPVEVRRAAQSLS